MPTKREVKFTHVEKVFFPKTGFTKGDMVAYYLAVSRWLLPHLKNRPITLVRFPDGLSGERFYEKNAPSFAPAWIKTFGVPRRHESGEVNYMLINDAPTLAWCANIAGLELHPFLHHAPKIDQPTQVVFDLDPGEGADVLSCIHVAFLVKEILDGLGLQAFAKVSGSKGLQLYVPLNTKTSYEATGAFAKAVAELLEQRHPSLVVSKMDKVKRRKKTLIDWSQNSQSKTTVAVYSMRGKRDEPFISMPVSWPELARAQKTRKRSALFFTPRQAIQRLQKQGDLFAPVLSLKQKLPKAFAAASSPVDPETLEAYRAKRDFSRTREPRPADVKAKASSKTRGKFVIQKHAATRLHYDFRLEMEGTLKSWAVPKGVPTEPGVKRAAFEVEDHPLAYLKFEGTIPKGQYGGGTVMVWDLGTYKLLGGSYAAGDLKLQLTGRKLKGEWHLFRIRAKDEAKPVWLLVKAGRAAKAISARQDDTSVLSRRSLARIAKDNDPQWPAKRRRR